MESAARMCDVDLAIDVCGAARQAEISPGTTRTVKTEDLVIIPPGFASSQSRRNASKVQLPGGCSSDARRMQLKHYSYLLKRQMSVHSRLLALEHAGFRIVNLKFS
jgi:hypothetical protein